MSLLRLPRFVVAGMFGVALAVAGGCSSSTKVTFEGPPGSVMFVEGKPHHLPASITLSRPAGTDGSTRHDVALIATVQGQEVKAKGQVEAFAYTASDVDKKAVNTCVLDEQNLAYLIQGKTVVFAGKSASRQRLYELTLNKER